MLLKAKAVDAAQPQAKPYKLNDGRGLHCLVNPNGSKLWRWRYEVAGKEKTLAIGAFPDVSLAQARDMAEEARRVRKAGGDPSADKRKDKVAAERNDTFGHFAAIALATALAKCDEKTAPKWTLHMRYATDHFGAWPVASITRGDVLTFLRGWEAVGKIDTMHSIKRKMSAAFEVARDFEACEHNPAIIGPKRLESVRRVSHPAILDPVRFGQLLRAIDGYQGQPATTGCLKLAALCFARPAEIRMGRWREINWEQALWEIPAERMKTVGGQRYAHLIPLSRQALAVLRQMQAIYGHGELIFPALGKKDRPVSEGTMNAALVALGFAKNEHVPHGFRATANTLMLEKLKWPRWISEPAKVVDRQLAHIEPDETKRAYDRAQFIDARTWAMQAWADYCDVMKTGGKVIPLERRSS